MRLLRTDCPDPTLVTFNNERELPRYAILSHTWGADGDEVTYEDLKDIGKAKSRPAWIKLEFAMQEAQRDGLQYVWIDTCCIDKTSSAELAESLNSMFRWYQRSAVCYAYLSDMPEPEVADITGRTSAEPRSKSLLVAGDGLVTELVNLRRNHVEQYFDVEWDWHQFRTCRWFTRAWTLQEMLSPAKVQFFSRSWVPIGSLATLADVVSKVTNIHVEALTRERSVFSFSIAQRMSWASQRESTRIEDEAYSLLGLFDLSLPIIYGEGRRSFLRLQEEILRTHADHTIFGWSLRRDCWEQPGVFIGGEQSSTLLADSPRAFEQCQHLVPVKPEERHRAYELTNSTIRFDLPVGWRLDQGLRKAVLNCRFEDSWTRNLCLNLKRTSTPDCYEVIGEDRRPRVQMMEIYGLSQYCEFAKFSIIRHPQASRRGIRQESPNCPTICRIKSRTLTSRDLQSFQITVSTIPPDWSGTAWIPMGHRNQFLRGFIQDPQDREIRPTTDNELSQQKSRARNQQAEIPPEQLVSSYIQVWEDNNVCAQLIVSEDPRQSSVRFLRKSGVVNWLQKAVLPDFMCIHGHTSLAAAYQKRQLLHEHMGVVEVETGGLILLIRGITRLLLHKLTEAIGLKTKLRLPLIFILFGLSAAIPVGAINVTRRQSYGQTRSKPSLDDAEKVGIALGLPLAFIVACLVNWKRDRIFTATFSCRNLRMVLMGVTIGLNLSTATLCGIYANLCDRHGRQTSVYFSGTSAASRYYTGSFRMSIVVSVLSASLALAFAFYRPMSRYLKLTSVGGKTALVSAVVNVVAIAFWAWGLAADHSTRISWWSLDCWNPTVFPDMYRAIAVSTSQSWREVCESFALERRLLIAILSLSACDMVINSCLAAYTAWRVYRLHMPQRKKWAVW